MSITTLVRPFAREAAVRDDQRIKPAAHQRRQVHRFERRQDRREISQLRGRVTQ